MTQSVVPSGEKSSGVVGHGDAYRIFASHISDMQADILDLGCGKGAFLGELHKNGYQHLSGIDANDYGMGIGDIKHGDIVYDKLPWPDSQFDAVTAWEVFEHLENPYAVMREVHRILKPSGLLMLSMPNSAHLESRLLFFGKGEVRRWHEKNDHITILTPAIFRKKFLTHFDLIEVRYPIPLLAKYGMLGKIHRRIKFVDRWVPANAWFGRHIAYVLKKKNN